MATRIPLALLAMALACSVFAAPAQALRARVFVSKTGADVGTCSFSAPCQSLDYALSGVEPGGEITILDSGGYNPITITQGVTITVPPGVEAGIAAASGVNAITINGTSAATITLRGLTLEGSGVGAHGIFLTSSGGGTLNIIDTVVKDFNNSGIAIQPGGSSNFALTILNSTSLNNGGDGFRIAPTGSSAQILVSIDQTTANGNDGNGFNFETGSNNAGDVIFGQIIRSQASTNKNAGINGSGYEAPNAIELVIAGCYGTNNLYGVNVNIGGAYHLSSSTFLGNNTDLNIGSATTFYSFGNNAMDFVTATVTSDPLH